MDVQDKTRGLILNNGDIELFTYIHAYDYIYIYINTYMYIYIYIYEGCFPLLTMISLRWQ